MSLLLKGKIVADDLYQKISAATEFYKSKTGRPPTLATVLVGNDPGSQAYVKIKGIMCQKLGFGYIDKTPEATISQGELNQLICTLNEDPAVDGILVQQPLPKHLDESQILDLIEPRKDVDCFSPHNVGLLQQGRPAFLPCTPAGIIQMLKFYKIPIEGRSALIIGRSNIVGKPMSMLLLQENATVQIAHSKTTDLNGCIANADIVIAAIGRPHFLDESRPWKKSAVVIDVGINRLANGKLVGDVNTESVSRKVEAISPVPGGVGPLTIAILMRNTVVSALLTKGLPTDKSGL